MFKQILLIVLFGLLTATASAQKIQQQGIVGTSDCTTRGIANASCLPLTSQIWDSYNSQTLAASISGGSLGGSASAVTKTITASNSFSVGNWVYLNGSTYTLAQANTASAAEIVGIVTAATGTQFTIATSGYVTGLSGLTAGTVYFESPTTAGAMTATEPTTAGQIDRPVFVADSTTSGYVVQYRGAVIASASGAGPYSASITNNGTTAAIVSQKGGWLASATRNSAGTVTLAINSGIFATTPICNITRTATGGGFNTICAENTTSTSSEQVQCANVSSGTLTDVAFNITCQ